MTPIVVQDEDLGDADIQMHDQPGPTDEEAWWRHRWLLQFNWVLPKPAHLYYYGYILNELKYIFRNIIFPSYTISPKDDEENLQSDNENNTATQAGETCGRVGKSIRYIK